MGSQRVLTCRDLYRLGLTDFADHDPRAIRDGGCSCCLPEAPGQLLYEESQTCRCIHEIDGGDFVVEVCCCCADGWEGTDDELLAEVREALASPGYCVVEVVRRATDEASYAPCEEDRREQQALANTVHGSVRIVLQGLSRETAVRVAARMTKVRSREERRARFG